MFWKVMFVLLAISIIYVPSEASADKCGSVQCKDISGTASAKRVTKIIETSKSGCQSVSQVHLLDKSEPGVMMIYPIKCDDGQGVQKYQLIDWEGSREINIDKHSGELMKPIKLRY